MRRMLRAFALTVAVMLLDPTGADIMIQPGYNKNQNGQNGGNSQAQQQLQQQQQPRQQQQQPLQLQQSHQQQQQPYRLQQLHQQQQQTPQLQQLHQQQQQTPQLQQLHQQQQQTPQLQQMHQQHQQTPQLQQLYQQQQQTPQLQQLHQQQQQTPQLQQLHQQQQQLQQLQQSHQQQQQQHQQQLQSYQQQLLQQHLRQQQQLQQQHPLMHQQQLQHQPQAQGRSNDVVATFLPSLLPTFPPAGRMFALGPLGLYGGSFGGLRGFGGPLLSPNPQSHLPVHPQYTRSVDYKADKYDDNTRLMAPNPAMKSSDRTESHSNDKANENVGAPHGGSERVGGSLLDPFGLVDKAGDMIKDLTSGHIPPPLGPGREHDIFPTGPHNQYTEQVNPSGSKHGDSAVGQKPMGPVQPMNVAQPRQMSHANGPSGSRNQPSQSGGPMTGQPQQQSNPVVGNSRTWPTQQGTAPSSPYGMYRAHPVTPYTLQQVSPYGSSYGSTPNSAPIVGTSGYQGDIGDQSYGQFRIPPGLGTVAYKLAQQVTGAANPSSGASPSYLYSRNPAQPTSSTNSQTVGSPYSYHGAYPSNGYGRTKDLFGTRGGYGSMDDEFALNGYDYVNPMSPSGFPMRGLTHPQYSLYGYGGLNNGGYSPYGPGIHGHHHHSYIA